MQPHGYDRFHPYLMHALLAETAAHPRCIAGSPKHVLNVRDTCINPSPTRSSSVKPLHSQSDIHLFYVAPLSCKVCRIRRDEPKNPVEDHKNFRFRSKKRTCLKQNLRGFSLGTVVVPSKQSKIAEATVCSPNPCLTLPGYSLCWTALNCPTVVDCQDFIEVQRDVYRGGSHR